MEQPKSKTVEDFLNEISYAPDNSYVPTNFALEFVNFIKLVNGDKGEEHVTPVMHYRMLDQLAQNYSNIANMCARGTAKTTLLAEYLFLYLAVYGELPNFGRVNLALYVSDSIENGVKNMRKNLEYRWENSEFLQKYIPFTRFTDIRWEFQNVEGKTFIIKGYGAKTGVRGAKEMAVRPQLAILDDLVSDEDAKSPTIIASIEDTVYKAVTYALHPTHFKIIWSGTPFNAKDPLYKAVESGAWAVNVYPICEEFPVPESEFRGCWPDRFPYSYVWHQYDKAMRAGKIETFNQELMLRIMSDEDRLIKDDEIMWYKRDHLLKNRGAYNFYITTDFATSERTSADFSAISVWAYDNAGNWRWVDGIYEKQLMNKNVDDLFRLVQEYKPLEVGIEISGQQKGFIPWLDSEMLSRNIIFSIGSDKHSNERGFRPPPRTNKFERFYVVVPLFKLRRIWFPEELKDTEVLRQALTELTLVSRGGFKAKHDDFCDTVAQLPLLNAWKPSQVPPEEHKRGDKYWDDIYDIETDETPLERYII